MSAIAATRTHDGMICLSDGALTIGGQLNRHSGFSKLKKLNDHLAFFWIGRYPSLNCMDNMADKLPNTTSIKRMGKAVSRELKDIYQPLMKDWDKRERFMFILLDGRGCHYGYDSDRNQPFKPLVQRPKGSPVGKSIYFGYDVKDSDGQRYMANVQTNINAGLPINMACNAGFSKLMNEFSSEGRKVGGQIFQEVIRPHH